jgi:hypothetical protein
MSVAEMEVSWQLLMIMLDCLQSSISAGQGELQANSANQEQMRAMVITSQEEGLQ